MGELHAENEKNQNVVLPYRFAPRMYRLRHVARTFAYTLSEPWRGFSRRSRPLYARMEINTEIYARKRRENESKSLSKSQKKSMEQNVPYFFQFKLLVGFSVKIASASE